MVALVWHKKHIEERTGRGILPVINSRMADVDSVGSRRRKKTRLSESSRAIPYQD